uniref:Protein KTI12 homolog n=1 Tax=Tetraodon nigroviridis TaxID=99883 RepID=H3DPK4_TETNG
MPLIVICGYPCSGKTRRAEELKAYFEQNGDKKVYIVGEGGLDVDRNTVYADSQKEKDVRSSLKAEVERKINKDDVVILDSLNYIKGYRYELFCLVKHAQTPHCLVSIHDASSLKYPHLSQKFCPSSAPAAGVLSDVRTWAEMLQSGTTRTCEHVSFGAQFCPVVLFCSFDALVLRFEAPDSRNRWDSPLFTILQDDTLPYEDISDALFKRKAPPPNQSTQSQPLSSANFLYELDKITQDVLMVIFNAQKTSVPGDLILVPGATENFHIQFNRSVNMAELRKLRRQFISYTKMHPTENTGHVSNMFVQYLNKSLH